jgi:hypothetical protein
MTEAAMQKTPFGEILANTAQNSCFRILNPMLWMSARGAEQLSF